MTETLLAPAAAPSIDSEVGTLLAAARAAGRTHLTEPEALAAARALGIGVPFHLVVAGAAAAAAADLSLFPGDRVVVKVVSDRILHKSDAGGVAVVARESRAVTAAVREMERRFAGMSVQGYSLNEFVPHDAGLGGQLLLGMRWTDDFGPVVTLGPGGLYAELLAASLRPEAGTAVLSSPSPERIAAALAGKAITPVLTGGLRGQPARIEMAALTALLARALDFAAATMPHAVAELEINPLVSVPGDPRGLVALDALLRLGTGSAPAHSAPPRPVAKIRHLLAPQTVAVVGVSEKMNPGHIILKNLLAAGFDPARLLVVKPGRDEIDGCRCVPDLASLPGRVDLAVLAIAAAQAPAAVEEIVAAEKAESVILIPGGLGETGGSGERVARLRAALDRSRASRWGGPVVNGGNCLGVRSVPGRVNTLFIPEPKLRFPAGPPAPLALIAQSGAFAVARASGLWSLNPRHLITVGNQLDLTAGDYLTFLADDPETEVFACYVEGFRPLDGRRWLAAASRIVAGGRPVILYRAGRTAAGRQATASHTATIAGDYAVTRELAASAGVLVAESLEDFDDLVRLCCRLRGKRVDGLRLAALSNAGFEAVAIADHLGPFTPAVLGEATRERLAALLAGRRLGGIVDVHNPLDVTPILDDAGYEEAARALLEEEGADAGVVGCVPLAGALSTLAAGEGHAEDAARPGAVADRLARLFAEQPKAWVAVVDGGPLYDAMARLLEERGVPTFRAADRALRLFGRYCEWRDMMRRCSGAPPCS